MMALAGIYGFVIWLVLVIVITSAASARGRSGPKYFFVSLLFSPIVGYMALTAHPDNPVRRETPEATGNLKGGLNI